MKRNGSIAPLLIAMFAASTACTPKTPLPVIPDDYAGWTTTTEIELDYPIPGHLGHYRKIYINAIGTGVTTDESGRTPRDAYPTGTKIVKEIYPRLDYAPGDRPVLLTCMVKAPDHPDSRGGWLWIAKNPETGAVNAITEEFCVTCHANANEKHPYGDRNPDGAFRDYVFFPYRSD